MELINSKGYARVIDIAGALKISQASVTNMVQRLDTEGLIKYEKYRGLILTAAGIKLARRIAQRHKLLSEFLRLLGVDDRVIDHDVEGMEHHISPSTLRAIAMLTQQLQRRPALRARLQAGAVLRLPGILQLYGFLELVAVAAASLNFLKCSCFTRRLSASETVTK